MARSCSPRDFTASIGLDEYDLQPSNDINRKKQAEEGQLQRQNVQIRTDQRVLQYSLLSDYNSQIGEHVCILFNAQSVLECLSDSVESILQDNRHILLGQRVQGVFECVLHVFHPESPHFGGIGAQ